MITAKLDLACVTGIYDRDFKNYRYICRPCHTKIDNHKHFKDMSKRICSSYKTNETYIRRDGTMSWNHADGELLCGRCYNKSRRARKSMDDNNKSRKEFRKSMDDDFLKSFIPVCKPTTVYRLQKK